MQDILIVEDGALMAERLAELATVPGRTRILAKCMTEDEALAWCDRSRIDIALVDLQLAQGTGFGVIRRLRERGRPPCAILVVTNHAVPALKCAAFEAGADYFLDKCKDLSTIPRLVGELLQAAAETEQEEREVEDRLRAEDDLRRQRSAFYP